MTSRSTLTLAGAVAATAILASCSGSPSRTTGSQPPHGGGSSAQATNPGGPSSATALATNVPAPKQTESNPPGDIPDSQTYVAFRPAGAGYSVKIPEGWARTAGGRTTAFTDKLNHIEVSTVPARRQPTIDSVTRTDVPSLKAKTPQYATGKVSAVLRGGGNAILLTYQGDSAPDQVTGKVVRNAFERYTFYRPGRRVDLTFSGPTNADNVDPWRIVSDSLRWG